MKIIILVVIVCSVLAAVFYAVFIKEKNISPDADLNLNLMQPKEKITAIISTGKGDISLELYLPVAPKTVNNFIKLANDGFYNGTKFHRVIADFMIQGGDPLSKTDNPRVGTGGPGYQFEDEINPRAIGVAEESIAQLERAGYKYDYSLKSMPVDVGSIAMANSGPNTNGSQFFIVTYSAQSHLNGRHTVFGKVTDEVSMNVVRNIKQGDVISSITIRN